MAKLMKAVAYRKLERPYTRKSKYRKKDFIRGVPTNKVIKYNMGNLHKKFTHKITLVSKADIQLRHNAIESARKTANKHLETKAPANYMFKIRLYCHHVLRNNPLAAGAGADRMSTGMSHSFGKPIGVAARVKKGQEIMEAYVNENRIDVGKKALHRARQKFPCDFYVRVEKIEN